MRGKREECSTQEGQLGTDSGVGRVGGGHIDSWRWRQRWIADGHPMMGKPWCQVEDVRHCCFCQWFLSWLKLHGAGWFLEAYTEMESGVQVV